MNKLKKLIFVLLMCALLALCACGDAVSYDEVEKTEYQHDYGFAFTAPAAWERLSASDAEVTGDTVDDNSDTEDRADFTQYRFVDESGKISLLLLSEMGGMEYDSPADNCTQMADKMDSTLFADSKWEALKEDDPHYMQLIRGTAENGAELVCRVDMWHPFDAVRHYMIFIADADAYAENVNIIEGISDSMSFHKAAEEVYQLMQDDRDAALQALLDQMEQDSLEDADGDTAN